MSTRKKHIVILGGGTSGWVTASILSKNLKDAPYKVTIIESDKIAPVGVGEASIPPIYSLIEYLEIDDSDLLSKVDGSLKYGIHFENWSKPGESYMHAFGELGTPYKDIPFLDFWFASANRTGIDALTPFFPTAVAAYNNKFSPPAPRPKGSPPKAFYPLCNLSYALHFDATLMANYLKEYAVANGVKHINATVTEVTLAKKGHISSLTLDNDETIKGSLFVDCSGERGRLIKKELKQEIEDWSDYLPCDRAVAVQTKSDENPLPSYTKAIAMNAGWRWQIPLQSRTGNGYVYCSKYLSDEEAKAELLAAVDGTPISEPRLIPFKTGCLARPWVKNCVAIGLSSGFMEPMESTSIHLIYTFALQLRKNLDDGNWNDSDAFNKLFSYKTERIRDFLVMHYHINKKDNLPFWRDCQTMTLPSELVNKLAEFKQTGRIKLDPSDLFSFESWVQILVGQKYLDDYKAFENPQIPQDLATQFFKNVFVAIQSEVKKLPDHRAFLNNVNKKMNV
ncbi:tryptophan halogenase family protein [Agaribacter marinus]|uniref:Tryptophan halogenase n=1 Tax=Agaribacter marinus TaxID=1431249 RepID=A0AA37WJ53_9ALTE|nr:tryptophan halogenase family protein [Agaribacter marinus]GLR69889.1 tryptophan halogenase [Agaribacter marinus]